MRPLAIHVVFVLAVLALGLAAGAIFAPGDWYAGLRKPAFTSPGRIFAPVWTGLYVLIAIAGARTWISASRGAGMRLWFLQMVLNLLWSPAFFGANSPILGLVVILPLLALVLMFIVERWDRDRIAALLFVPYALWIAFASLINGQIYVLN